MADKNCPVEGRCSGYTHVAVTATPVEEKEIVTKVRQFAWDVERIRVARKDPATLMFRFSECLEPACVRRLAVWLGQEAHGVKPPLLSWRVVHSFTPEDI